MITAETVNGIVRFQANGLPVVSLYCRVDPGESQREVRARVDSLLDQIAADLLHDPDPMRIARREGGTVAPDGGPLTNAAYYRARQWRQEWLALRPEPVIPAVIGPDGAVYGGPDGLRCLAGIAEDPADG